MATYHVSTWTTAWEATLHGGPMPTMDDIRTAVAADVGVDAPLDDGWTAAMVCAANDDAEPLRLLLDHGASMDIGTHGMDGARGQTVLHIAAMENATACVRLLLANGARVDAADTCGGTPLMAAATPRRPDPTGEDAIAILLAHGADPGRRDGGDLSAIGRAAAAGRVATMRRLLTDPRTTIHDADVFAVIRGMEPHDGTAAIDLLCDHGAGIPATIGVPDPISTANAVRTMAGQWPTTSPRFTCLLWAVAHQLHGGPAAYDLTPPVSDDPTYVAWALTQVTRDPHAPWAMPLLAALGR